MTFFCMETYSTIQAIDKIWRYTFELRKRRIFFPNLQTKVQKPAWKGENVVVTKLSPNQINRNKNNDNDGEVEELNMIHQVNYLLTARSKFDVVLQPYPSQEQTSCSSVIH